MQDTYQHTEEEQDILEEALDDNPEVIPSTLRR